ncbi:hypothetical protein F5887DRAFT_51143 [Amanita rubescens]|nr:hypothetical protein F5887DRAFT_51143 [Amanita rubescens]
MPAFRKPRCIGYASEPKPRVKRVLTEAEKGEAAMKRNINKLLKPARKEWEATLKPWVHNESLRLPIGTLAMYKSDAKKAFTLTESEMLTLPHESIANSPKTFFALDAIKALARRKHQAGALLMDPVDQAMLNATVWKKTEDNGRRNRTNWSVASDLEVPGSRLNLALEMMKAEKGKKASGAVCKLS